MTGRRFANTKTMGAFAYAYRPGYSLGNQEEQVSLRVEQPGQCCETPSYKTSPVFTVSIHCTVISQNMTSLVKVLCCLFTNQSQRAVDAGSCLTSAWNVVCPVADQMMPKQ